MSETPVGGSQTLARPFKPRFGSAYLAIAGLLPLLFAWPLYKLGAASVVHVGWVRTIALFDALAVGGLLVAALLALMVAEAPFDVAPWLRRHKALRLAVRAGLVAIVAVLLPLPWLLTVSLDDRPHVAASPVAPTAVTPRPDAPRRIVLITYDALRARSTTPSTAGRPTTPVLAALAHESHWYDDCRAGADSTLVSLAALQSGVSPRHFVSLEPGDGLSLREGSLTGLAGFLKPAGYTPIHAVHRVDPRALGFAHEFARGVGPLAPTRFPFNSRGFVPLDGAWRWALGRLTPTPLPPDPLVATRATFAAALEALKSNPGPVFLWVHLDVPHTPYYDVPPEALWQPLHAERYARVTEAELETADAARLKRYEAIYEHYVGFADAELGRFIQGLRAGGLWPETLLAVTSDHGESFEQPGVRPHGTGNLSEDVSRVPLLLHLPGQTQGQRIARRVGHQDLVPTLLAAVYPTPPTDLAGHSLLSEPGAERQLYTWGLSPRFAADRRQTQSLAAYQGRFKYLLARAPVRHEALFDLVSDPAARHDVQARHPDRLVAMRARTAADMGW